MAVQLKKTKPKKEKPAKAPKAPKAPKKPKASKPASSVVLKQGKGKRGKKDIVVKSGKKTNKTAVAIILVVVAVLAIVAAAFALTRILPDKTTQESQIQQIRVVSNPKKMVYLIGEEPDFSGLKIEGVRENGTTFTVYTSKCQITGFDSSTVGMKTITVAYEGYKTTFYVSVEEPPRSTPELVGITLNPKPKTEYKVGEWLDTDGGVILCEYADGSTHGVSLINQHVYGWENAYDQGAGTYTLTVRYEDNGVLAVTTYTIIVTE